MVCTSSRASSSSIRHRLDSEQRVQHVLQEHPVHLRRRLPGHVLPVAHDGPADGPREAVLLVLQTRRVRRAGGLHGDLGEHPRPRLADRLMGGEER